MPRQINRDNIGLTRSLERYLLMALKPQGTSLSHWSMHLSDWDLFQRAVSLLLIDGNDLAAIRREIAVATSNHSESVRALLAMNEQAYVAGNVKPPPERSAIGRENPPQPRP